MLMTPGLAFSIDMMGRGNGAVLRGHKQHIGDNLLVAVLKMHWLKVITVGEQR